MTCKVASSTSNISATKILSGMKKLPEQNCQNSNYIAITRCLTIPCPGFYTDTISERLLILCRDPRHNPPPTYLLSHKTKRTRTTIPKDFSH